VDHHRRLLNEVDVLLGELPAHLSERLPGGSKVEPRLMAAARLRLTGDRELAQDLLQEAFTRVWTMARTFDPRRGAFKGWLFTIALNAARSELARKRHAVRHVEPEEAEGLDPLAGNPERLLAETETRRRVEAALLRLSPHLREVVVLKVFHQLKFHEIARMTGAPEGTLKARFHRAVAELRERLGVAGGEA